MEHNQIVGLRTSHNRSIPTNLLASASLLLPLLSSRENQAFPFSLILANTFLWVSKSISARELAWHPSQSINPSLVRTLYVDEFLPFQSCISFFWSGALKIQP